MTLEEYKAAIRPLGLDDYSGWLKAGRNWKKIEREGGCDVKIGVVATNSIQLIVSALKALLCRYDIYADIYEGEYNGIRMDVFDDGSELYAFAPSYVIMVPDFRDIAPQRPDLFAADKEVDAAAENAAAYYQKACEKIHQNLPGCQILLSNFVEPLEDPLGGLAGNYRFSQSQFCRLVNVKLVAGRSSYVTLVDMEKVASNIGKSRWFDESAYFLNKSGFALPYIGYFCDAFARQFESFLGRPKKCLVLDLDNTLWGGVVGDLGYDGIMLDPNDAIGEAFLHFQRYLKALKERGVILAVCSKNDEENAKEPFEKNENMVLKLPDISSFKANWEDKASNIRAIASELNIGTDSFVFFDDNPTERALVREFLPEVKVVEVPEDPAFYVRALDQSFSFEWNQLTKEDTERAQSYAQNAARSGLLEACGNYDEFLKKLDMKVKWEPVSDLTVNRFAQLTNKSNQFNVRTQRYSEAEIQKMRESDRYGLYTVSLKDAFTSYGVIACVVLKFEQDGCRIENWVMSCRVLKKTVEKYTAGKIAETAREKNAACLKAEYIPSKKNAMVSGLFDGLGFECTTQDGEAKEYMLGQQALLSYEQEHFLQEEKP